MSAAVEELAGRVSRLEGLVGAADEGEPLNVRVVNLFTKTQQIIGKVPSFIPCFEQCTQYMWGKIFWGSLVLTLTELVDRLESQLTDREVSNRRSALSYDAKLELLLAAQTRIQSQAQLLKQIHDLTNFINPEPLQGV